MAKAVLAQKTVSYRRCLITPKPGQTLQQLVNAALAMHPTAGGRYEPLNPQSTELRFIGEFHTQSQCLCGFLTTFERGAAQPVIGDDPAAASLKLGALHPPAASKGGVQEQFVPGVLFFAIFENHVALAQTASVRGAALEAHLNWLLKSKTTLLPATSAFSLSDEAQKATKAKIKQSHVKSISLGQQLMTEVAAPATPVQTPVVGQGPKTKALPKKFAPTGPLVDLIKGYFADVNDFEKLGLSEVFDGNLEVWVEIRYPKRKRSQPEDAMRLMDTLGVALRDIDGDQVSLELANGLRVKGSELKISGVLSVPTLANKLPDQKALWDELVAWLTAQIANGVVDP